MGYWEQIAVSNLKYERRRAAMHPLRHKLGDALLHIFLYGFAILLWLIILSPLWILAVG